MACPICNALPHRKLNGAILHRSPCISEMDRMRSQIVAMAGILDELSVVLTHTYVPDWRVLPPVAEELVRIVRADVRLATSARRLATRLHAGDTTGR